MDDKLREIDVTRCAESKETLEANFRLLACPSAGSSSPNVEMEDWISAGTVEVLGP